MCRGHGSVLQKISAGVVIAFYIDLSSLSIVQGSVKPTLWSNIQARTKKDSKVLGFQVTVTTANVPQLTSKRGGGLICKLSFSKQSNSRLRFLSACQ